MAKPEMARPSDEYVDSVGVALHLGYLDGPYGKFDEIIKPRLIESGIRHVRDGYGSLGPDAPLMRKRFLELAKHGIKSTLILTDRSKEAVLSEVKIMKPALNGIEGPNETDLPQFGFSYQGLKFPEGTKNYMRDLYSWMKADPETRDVPVLSSSVAWGKNTEQFGNWEAHYDIGNGHFYTALGLPPGDALFSWHLKYARLTTPTKPLIVTETSYSSAINAGGLTEWAHARYVPRLLLEHFRVGIQRTHIYEFIDEWSDPNDEQGNFGLLRLNNTPKPAFTLIKNLNLMLADPGPKFKAGALDFEIEGASDITHHFLLQKRDGSFYLVIWQDAKNIDLEKKAEIHVPDLPVTLRFARPMARVRTYRPLDYGQNALRYERNVSTVQIKVPDHPLVVRIEPKNLAPFDQ